MHAHQLLYGKHSFSAHATSTQNYEEAGSSRSTRASMLCWCHRLTFAKYDLPVPGGPYSRMPLQGFRLPARRGATCGTSQSAAKTGNPSEKVSNLIRLKSVPQLQTCLQVQPMLCNVPVKNCGNLTGRMTASFSASLAPSRPATSSH